MRAFEHEAKQVVRHLLENDVPVRACSQCEKEHGILRRDDPSKSHGLCKRHTIQWAREGGLSDADIQEILQTTSSFVPDLGPVPALEDEEPANPAQVAKELGLVFRGPQTWPNGTVWDFTLMNPSNPITFYTRVGATRTEIVDRWKAKQAEFQTRT